MTITTPALRHSDTSAATLVEFAHFNRDELRRLASHQGLGISVVLTTYGSDIDSLLGPAQLKHHLDTIHTDLLAMGLPLDAVHALTMPLSDLADTPEVWEGMDCSLALFAGAGWTRAYRLPVVLEPHSAVGEGFRLHPLVAALPTTDQFFILRVHPDNVRLLLADAHDTIELHSGILPRGMDTSHYPTYLAHVGQALSLRLGEEETRPVVLACDATDAEHLRAASTYPHLVDGVIPNDWTYGSDHQLHRAATALVKPVLQQCGQALLNEQYEALLHGIVIDDPAQIEQAASCRAVHTLTVSPCVATGEASRTNLTPQDRAIAAVARTSARIVHLGVGGEAGALHATVLPAEHAHVDPLPS